MRALFILLSISGFAQAAIIPIDSFEVGEQTVTADSSNNNVTDTESGLDSNEVLEAERQLTIQGNMSVGNIVADVDTSGTGSLTYSSNNPAFTDGFNGRLIITHLLGNRVETYNLAMLNPLSYVIDFESTFFGGSGSFNATLSLSSPTGNDTTTVSVDESSTPFQVVVPFSELSSADFSNAYNLSLDFSGLSSVSTFEINNINLVNSESAAVPEPSSWILLIVCLACLRFVYRPVVTSGHLKH